MFLRGFAIIAAVLSVALSSSEATAGSKVAIRAGTPVVMRVDGSVSSESANKGDTFMVKADDDVVVNGWLAIKRGASGQGTVTSVDRAGKHGHQGSLGVRLDWIYATDGERIRLTTGTNKQTGEQRKGAASTATIGSTLLLGPVGLFAHNFVKGKDVTLDSSRVLTAYVGTTVHVAATQRAIGFAR